MKDILLIGIVIFVIIALFGDGGLEISPTISPDFAPQLDVNYAPDRSVQTTTIETQVLGDYVEQQTVVVQPVQAAQPVQSGGGTIAEGRPGAQCFTVPGDVIVDQGSNGECHVVNAGQRYFVAPSGARSWLRPQTEDPATTAQPQTPAKTIDERWAAIVPLDEMTTDQLKSNFTRNGGSLPLGFRFWSDGEQRTWLTARSEAWK